MVTIVAQISTKLCQESQAFAIQMNVINLQFCGNERSHTHKKKSNKRTYRQAHRTVVTFRAFFTLQKKSTWHFVYFVLRCFELIIRHFFCSVCFCSYNRPNCVALKLCGICIWNCWNCIGSTCIPSVNFRLISCCFYVDCINLQLKSNTYPITFSSVSSSHSRWPRMTRRPLINRWKKCTHWLQHE